MRINFIAKKWLTASTNRLHPAAYIQFSTVKKMLLIPEMNQKHSQLNHIHEHRNTIHNITKLTETWKCHKIGDLFNRDTYMPVHVCILQNFNFELVNSFRSKRKLNEY